MSKVQIVDFQQESRILQGRPKKRSSVFSFCGFSGTYKKVKSNTQLLIEDIEEEKALGYKIEHLQVIE